MLLSLKEKTDVMIVLTFEMFQRNTRVFSHQHWPGNRRMRKERHNWVNIRASLGILNMPTTRGSLTSEKWGESWAFLSFSNVTENSCKRKGSVSHLHRAESIRKVYVLSSSCDRIGCSVLLSLFRIPFNRILQAILSKKKIFDLTFPCSFYIFTTLHHVR